MKAPTVNLTVQQRRTRAAQYLRTFRRMECGADIARRNRVLRDAVKRIYGV